MLLVGLLRGVRLIGVLSEEHEKDVVDEFFQLFKTPWEFYEPGRPYEVVLSSKHDTPALDSKLLIVYGANRKRVDSTHATMPQPAGKGLLIERGASEIPIYGGCTAFAGKGEALLQATGRSKRVALRLRGERGDIVRVGFDLFGEVGHLLTRGQPPENALVPTLDLHIAILRDWILDAGIPVIEIPSIPRGYSFAACLTHDVDFAGIRRHCFDHTMWGFVYRVCRDVVKSVTHEKTSRTRVFLNCKALLSLPLVYLGVCRDFWLCFDEYARIEGASKSTFFMVPFKRCPGDNVGVAHAKWRATKYDVMDIREKVQELASNGFEIGVHGIDAWHNGIKAKQELKRIAQFTSQKELGVRSHWLCFGKDSARTLDEAGFAYDSTFGYNQTVGYRAGTTQVFRPLGSRVMLELPLHLQDSALLSPSMCTSMEDDAWHSCTDLFEATAKYGGVLTILWHLRSLAPERNWKDFYLRILQELKSRGVWFTTAGRVVDWFRRRRSVSFERVDFSDAGLQLILKTGESVPIPGFLLRVHLPANTGGKPRPEQREHVDVPWDGAREINVDLATRDNPSPSSRLSCFHS